MHATRVRSLAARIASHVGDGSSRMQRPERRKKSRAASPARAPESPVRIIGSRELHQNLPTILRDLEPNDVRYVLTVHGKPRAVMVRAEPYMNLVLDRKSPSEALVGLQLSALLGETLNAASLEDLEKALDPNSK